MSYRDIPAEIILEIVGQYSPKNLPYKVKNYFGKINGRIYLLYAPSDMRFMLTSKDAMLKPYHYVITVINDNDLDKFYELFKSLIKLYNTYLYNQYPLSEEIENCGDMIMTFIREDIVDKINANCNWQININFMRDHREQSSVYFPIFNAMSKLNSKINVRVRGKLKFTDIFYNTRGNISNIDGRFVDKIRFELISAFSAGLISFTPYKVIIPGFNYSHAFPTWLSLNREFMNAKVLEFRRMTKKQVRKVMAGVNFHGKIIIRNKGGVVYL